MSIDLSAHNFLCGRSAIVTGGLSGIGESIAKRLANHGANVLVGSRRAVEQENVKWENGIEAGQIRIAPLDVQSLASIDRFAKSSQDAFGPTDILVNAAGITAEQGVVGHSDALWDQIIGTNLTGAFQMTRVVLPDMIARGWGRIINVGSTAATVGWKDNPAYCASKAGLLGLTRCVALEGAEHGVSCTMVSPTWVETELMEKNTAEIAQREGQGRKSADIVSEIVATNPQKRIIQPDEIAAAVVFLCREEALGISMENIKITGGAHW